MAQSSSADASDVNFWLLRPSRPWGRHHIIVLLPILGGSCPLVSGPPNRVGYGCATGNSPDPPKPFDSAVSAVLTRPALTVHRCRRRAPHQTTHRATCEFIPNSDIRRIPQVYTNHWRKILRLHENFSQNLSDISLTAPTKWLSFTANQSNMSLQISV